jgi:hypothetical protein
VNDSTAWLPESNSILGTHRRKKIVHLLVDILKAQHTNSNETKEKLSMDLSMDRFWVAVNAVVNMWQVDLQTLHCLKKKILICLYQTHATQTLVMHKKKKKKKISLIN